MNDDQTIPHGAYAILAAHALNAERAAQEAKAAAQGARDDGRRQRDELRFLAVTLGALLCFDLMINAGTLAALCAFLAALASLP